MLYMEPTESIENNNVNKSITLNRQCERFLHDLLNTLTDHHIHIERYLKHFRNQLNKIHEIVKFRTAIPITSIFVSIEIIPYHVYNTRMHARFYTWHMLVIPQVKHIPDPLTHPQQESSTVHCFSHTSI